MDDLIQLFTLTSMGFGLMLALKLLTIKKHGLIVMWLGLYVMLLVGTLAEILMPEQSPALLFIGATYWLIGPILFWYIKERNAPGHYVFIRDCAVHFIPFCVYLSIMLLAKVQDWSINDDIVQFVLYELVFIHILTYFLRSLKLLRNVSAKDRLNQSKRMPFAAMNVITIISLAIFACSWISTHIMVFARAPFSSEFQMVVQSVLSLLIFVIALLNTESRFIEPAVLA